MVKKGCAVDEKEEAKKKSPNSFFPFFLLSFFLSFLSFLSFLLFFLFFLPSFFFLIFLSSLLFPFLSLLSHNNSSSPHTLFLQSFFFEPSLFLKPFFLLKYGVTNHTPLHSCTNKKNPNNAPSIVEHHSVHISACVRDN